MLTLTRVDETALAGTMTEIHIKAKGGSDAGRPRVSREKRETVGAVTVENPRMVCRNVNVSYGDKHAIKNALAVIAGFAPAEAARYWRCSSSSTSQRSPSESARATGALR